MQLIPKKDIRIVSITLDSLKLLTSGSILPEQCFKFNLYDSNLCFNETDKTLSKTYSSYITKCDFQDVTKVYFDKLTKFPRSKMAAYSKFKRTINPDKADIYVVPDKLPSSETPWINFYKVTYNKQPLILGISRYQYCGYVFPNCSIYNQKDPNTIKIIKILKHFNVIRDYEFMSTCVRGISDTTFNLLNKMLTKPYTFVSDKDFSQFINSNTTTLTKDNFEFLMSLITSEDEGSHQLALETLCNFNILETPASIALLVEKCPNKKQFSSNSIKQLFKDLEEITQVNVANYCYRDKKLSFLTQKTLQLPKPKDVEILKDYVTNTLRDYLYSTQREFFNGCDSVFNINLVKDEE